MKQYCRYCANLVTGNGIYCCENNKVIAESTAKTINHCKNFVYNEIDAFYETKGYTPRKANQSKIHQLKLE